MKQAQDKGKPKSTKDEPASPKYLLGVPTSEPLFFKSPGGRQPQSTGSSPQAQPPTGKSPGNIIYYTMYSQFTGAIFIKTPRFVVPRYCRA